MREGDSFRLHRAAGWHPCQRRSSLGTQEGGQGWEPGSRVFQGNQGCRALWAQPGARVRRGGVRVSDAKFKGG